MTSVATRKLPHGALPFAQAREASVRDALMKLNENLRSLDRRLAAVERAVNELQRRQ